MGITRAVTTRAAKVRVRMAYVHFVLGWVAAKHQALVVAKYTGHHGWGKNPGWN